jgi:RNase P subunit RPR2
MADDVLKKPKQAICPHCDAPLSELRTLATKLGNGQIVQFLLCGGCMKTLPYQVIAVEQPKILTPFTKN